MLVWESSAFRIGQMLLHDAVRPGRYLDDCPGRGMLAGIKFLGYSDERRAGYRVDLRWLEAAR
jgi:hypothetical protein